ncbi:hypothetical protein PFICI_00021 [Pestalotiopsis fici W106-1]|uniref:Galactose-1-phosphate uridylyltransferase n=1 Tax=Pestalotiopsis fici (strain W106-1 / CGMCC3.15140) TaxID=1229662 RepID=W3XJG6_PESFW|nr:uncharacterized protein PFICI_00021 [Pestalotiopsis fici W106-1]ETS86193.1 hypothetical protein PFICI_00021 [Pestalotiopsis fici W106-1]
MTIEEVHCIIEAWAKLYAIHLSPDNPLKQNLPDPGASQTTFTDGSSSDARDLVYMQIFDNNGSIVGASNPHPHGQIWITSSMPDEPRKEQAQMKKYREENCGAHLLGAYVSLEMDKQERVVWQNEGFLAVCPWWAVWPYEVLLLPKRHVPSLAHLTASEKLFFSEAMLQLNRIYDNLLGITFPYVSAIHQAPLNATGEDLESSYLHVHFSPPLLFPSIKKFFGGYELYGEPTREITPEDASAQLRASLARLSEPSVKSTGSESPDEAGSQSTSCAKESGGRKEKRSSWWRRIMGKCIRV